MFQFKTNKLQSVLQEIILAKMLREQLIQTVRCDVRYGFIMTKKNNFLYYGRNDEAKPTLTSEKMQHVKEYVKQNTELSYTSPIVS